MKDETLYAMARWYFLAAQDAHETRLPAGCLPSSRRALRLASATLLRELKGAASRNQARSLLGSGFPDSPHRWRVACLSAGARCFSSALRRATAGAVAQALAEEMGPEPWRAALKWVDPELDPAVAMGEPYSVALVQCAGAEILMARLEGPEGPFGQRMRLSFAADDLQFCRQQLPKPGSAGCMRIAVDVLAQATG